MEGAVAELTWADVLGMAMTIAEEVRRERPDVIVAVLKGGAYPAIAIAARLGVERLYAVEFKKYSDEKPPKPMSEAPVLVRSDVPQLQGERVLVVDDVARTGSTLRAARELVKSKGAGEVRTAALVLKSQGVVEQPDYYAVLMKACALFPWEL